MDEPDLEPLDVPGAEVDIDVALVRALLADQHPDLADRSLRPLASGWDNAMFRLGDDLTVRLPRRALAAELVEHEQRVLPGLAGSLPLPVPVPVRVGRPALGYPWSWSVLPWFPGAPATEAAVRDPAAAAAILGAFVAALHVPAPADAPRNPDRGIPLDGRTDQLAEDLARAGSAVDAARVRARWAELVVTPPWSAPPQWIHGDLHAANVLVHDGRLAAVIDFGDVASGDPACDLAIGWMLFDPGPRAVFRSASGADDHTWARARGWALCFGVVYLARSADNEVFQRLGRRTLDAALAAD